MIVSVDFDNTVADYEAAFPAAAARLGLCATGFRGGRQALREHIRQSPPGEAGWMRLQGHVYGAGIGAARLSPGFVEFARRLARRGHTVAVVSHKTRRGHFDETGTDLHAAALGWMEAQGLFAAEGAGLARRDVYFETSLDDKLARIAALAPVAHVDDLIGVLTAAGFPAGVRRILWAGNGGSAAGDIVCCADWVRVEEIVAGVAVG